jgi:pantothenate kinase type III
MTIRSDRWIRERARQGMIEPFVEHLERQGVISYGLSSFGYDLRAAPEWRVFVNAFNTVVDPKAFDPASFVELEEETCIIPPNSFVLTRSVEYLRIPDDVLVVAPLLSIETERPAEVGADRLVNAVAALAYEGDAMIAVDFGTAANFDLIVRPDRLLGVALAPGPMIAAEALFERAAKLPRVDLTAPERAVGRTTVDALRSGLVFGYAEMVDGMVGRIEREAREEIGPAGRLRVIATGGFAEVVAPHARRIEVVDPLLTLDGLRRVADALA